MNRREMLSSIGAVGAATLASSSALAATAAKGAAGKKSEALQIVYDCIEAANVCIDACLDELATSPSSDKALSIRACRDCIAVCETLAQLISSDSAHLKAYAALSIQICADCEKYCDDGDPACRACVEACRACIALCRTLAA